MHKNELSLHECIFASVRLNALDYLNLSEVFIGFSVTGRQHHEKGEVQKMKIRDVVVVGCPLTVGPYTLVSCWLRFFYFFTTAVKATAFVPFRCG